MSQLYLVVKAEVDESVEEQWNDWYNNKHIPDVMSCPGFLSSKRLVSEVSGKRKYIAIYKLESDAAVCSDEFESITGWGEFSKFISSESGLYKEILCEV